MFYFVSFYEFCVSHVEFYCFIIPVKIHHNIIPLKIYVCTRYRTIPQLHFTFRGQSGPTVEICTYRIKYRFLMESYLFCTFCLSLVCILKKKNTVFESIHLAGVSQLDTQQPLPKRSKNRNIRNNLIVSYQIKTHFHSFNGNHYYIIILLLCRKLR